jgi:hypothetical protein
MVHLLEHILNRWETWHTHGQNLWKGKRYAQITVANTLSVWIHSMFIIHRSNHVTQLINLKLLDKSINSTSKPEATGQSNPQLLLQTHAKYWSQDPHRMTETTDITATSIANTSRLTPKACTDHTKEQAPTKVHLKFPTTPRHKSSISN